MASTLQPIDGTIALTTVAPGMRGVDSGGLQITIKMKLDATVDPTGSDNFAGGWAVGSKWVNTAGVTVWECVGDGVWEQLNASGSPGGSDQDLQINNAGEFGGGGPTWDGTNFSVGVAGTYNVITLNGVTGSGGIKIVGQGAGDTKLYLDGVAGVVLRCSQTEFMRANASSGVVVNDGGTHYQDFRCEGDTKTHLLFVDASTDTVLLDGDVGIGSTTIPTANGGKVLFFGDNGATHPTLGSGTTAIYQNSGEKWVQNTAATTTQISPHPLDAPPDMYQETPGLEDFLVSIVNARQEIRWRNNNTGDKRTETFDVYNARRQLSPGDPGFLAFDWDAREQDRLAQRQAEQSAWDVKRSADITQWKAAVQAWRCRPFVLQGAPPEKPDNGIRPQDYQVQANPFG